MRLQSRYFAGFSKASVPGRRFAPARHWMTAYTQGGVWRSGPTLFLPEPEVRARVSSVSYPGNPDLRGYALREGGAESWHMYSAIAQRWLR